MPLTPEERIEQLQRAIDEAKGGFDGVSKRVKQLEDERDAAIAAKKQADDEAAKKQAPAKSWGWW